MARYLISSKKFKVHLGIVPYAHAWFPDDVVMNLRGIPSHDDPVLDRSIEELYIGADFKDGV